MELPNAYAPRIYFVHSVLVGPLDAWPACFAHAASLGFDHLLIGALFAPGPSGDGRIVSDHARLHPAFRTDQSADDAMPPAWLNKALSGVFSLEAPLASGPGLPFGLSIAVIARKG